MDNRATFNGFDDHAFLIRILSNPLTFGRRNKGKKALSLRISRNVSKVAILIMNFSPMNDVYLVSAKRRAVEGDARLAQLVSAGLQSVVADGGGIELLTTGESSSSRAPPHLQRGVETEITTVLWSCL